MKPRTRVGLVGLALAVLALSGLAGWRLCSDPKPRAIARARAALPAPPDTLLASLAFVVIGYEGNLPLLQAGTVPPPKNGLGLATPIDAAGYFLAAAHSLDPHRDVYLLGRLDGRWQARKARVVFRGEVARAETDYALLKVDARPAAILPLAETRPGVGERVFAAVRLGAAPVLEAGVCLEAPGAPTGTVLQTDLPAASGDSGGPLLTADLRLLGLTSRGWHRPGLTRTFHCCPAWPEVRDRIARDQQSAQP